MAEKHLLDFVPEFPSTSRQKKVSGPCPWCGGEDRFVVFVNQGEQNKGSYYCFDNPGKGCGRGGDAITFLEEYHDKSWAEACKALGLEEKLEEYSGKTEEDRRIEMEKQAPDAALRVKKWNIVRQRINARERERRRRKKILRRKKKRERRRKIIESMDANERFLLSEVKVYRRTRRLHRAVARFVTLHASPPEYERIGKAARPTESAMEVLNQPSRFEHVKDLYRIFRRGLAEGFERAPRLDEQETKNRKEKLIEMAADAQKKRGERDP